MKRMILIFTLILINVTCLNAQTLRCLTSLNYTKDYILNGVEKSIVKNKIASVCFLDDGIISFYTQETGSISFISSRNEIEILIDDNSVKTKIKGQCVMTSYTSDDSKYSLTIVYGVNYKTAILNFQKATGGLSYTLISKDFE